MKYLAVLLLIAGCTVIPVTPSPVITLTPESSETPLATAMATWTPTLEISPTIETFTETPTWTATPTPTATSTEVPLMAVAVTLGPTVQAATPIILTVIPSGLGHINVYEALCYARFFIYELYPWQLIIVRDSWGYESCIHNWVRK